MMIGRLIVCCLLFSLNAFGQEQDTICGGTPEKSTPTLLGRLRQVQAYLDSAAHRKVDPRYIEVPAKPWRVILRYKENAVMVDYENRYEIPEVNEYTDWKMNFEPPVAASVGIWAGYRGTGLSFSKSLAKNAGRYFSISSTGARYGFNFQLRRFNTTAVTVTAKNYQNGQEIGSYEEEGNMVAPVWIRSAYVNGYYVFNGRRYSQAAAYNQSVIQRRSAGSFLAGATWYQSSLDYSDIKNNIAILLSNNIGRIKVHQANIGLGYGYNFVPFRGFVINVMTMPSISVYNRVKVYKYDFNYCLPLPEADDEDYGQWNSQTKTWSNGKTHKPMAIVEGEGLEDYPDLEGWENGADTEHSALRLNVDLRLGIAYNWSNYFIGLQAQFNNFTYKKDSSKVTIIDGYARLSLGVRL